MLARRRTFIVREGVVELANGRLQSALPVHARVVSGNRARSHAGEGPGGRPRARRAGDGARVRRTRARGRRGPGVSFPRRRRPPARRPLSPHRRRERDQALRAARSRGAPARRRDPRGAPGPDERARVEIPLMLELGRAQLGAGETELAIRTLTRLERRAGDERRPDDRLRALLALADGAGARLARGRARLRPSDQDRLALRDRCHAGLDGGDSRRRPRAVLRRVVGRDRRPLPRDVARAASTRPRRASLARHPSALPADVALGLRERVDRRTETAAPRARERRRGGLRLLLLPAGRRRPASRALERRADARGRRNGHVRTNRQHALRRHHADASGVDRARRSALRRGEPAERRGPAAGRDRRLGERAPDVAPLRRRLGARAGAARRRRRGPRVPARLVCPRAGPDGLVLGSAAPHLPRGALAAARRPRARDDRSIDALRKPRAPHQNAPGAAART